MNSEVSSQRSYVNLIVQGFSDVILLMKYNDDRHYDERAGTCRFQVANTLGISFEARIWTRNIWPISLLE